MTITQKVAFSLGLAGLIVLTVGSLMRYHAGCLLLGNEMKRVQQVVSLRLSSNLPEVVYEYNLPNIGNIIAAEFSQEEVRRILVFGAKRDRLLCGMRRQPDGSLKREVGEASSLAEACLSVPLVHQCHASPAHILGYAEVCFDPDVGKRRLVRAILHEQAVTGISFLLLILLAARLVFEGVAGPIQAFRRHMQEVQQIAVKRPVPGAWTGEAASGRCISAGRTFSELQDMAFSLEGLLKALGEREEHLHITLDAIGDAVIVTTTSGQIERMNPVAQVLSGWTQEEAVGRLFSEVFCLSREPNRSPCENLVAEVMAAGKPGGAISAREPLRLVSRNGGERLITESASPIRDVSGETVGVVLVFRDISERVHLENQLRQSRKMDAIGQLAGGISHDFNNLLTIILGGVDLLLQKLPPNDPNRRPAQLIRDTAGNAVEVVNKLLVFSRKTRVENKPVHVHRILRDTAELLQHSLPAKIALNIDIGAVDDGVIGDAAELQNAFLNLGVNARDAMPQGGTLTFMTVTPPASPDLLEGRPVINVSVCDTGTGMTPDILDRIFEPFFTTKAAGKGTGLGLATTFGIVKRHGGFIRVASTSGYGSVFEIVLPLGGPPRNVE
jgi:PAS domain S-box-containing protein